MGGVHADVVRGRRGQLAEGGAAILAHGGLGSEHVHPILVTRVNEDLAVVHGPRVEIVDPPPGLPAVRAAVGPPLPAMLHGGIEDTRVGRGDGQPDAANVATRQAAAEPAPSAPAIGALVDPAPWAPTVEAPGPAEALIRGGVQRVGIRR